MATWFGADIAIANQPSPQAALQAVMQIHRLAYEDGQDLTGSRWIVDGSHEYVTIGETSGHACGFYDVHTDIIRLWQCPRTVEARGTEWLELYSYRSAVHEWAHRLDAGDDGLENGSLCGYEVLGEELSTAGESVSGYWEHPAERCARRWSASPPLSQVIVTLRSAGLENG